MRSLPCSFFSSRTFIPNMEVTSNILAFASGKGGVGKSVVTANLAEALVREGERVALIDADFGQSASPVLLNETPTMTVLEAVREESPLSNVLHETEAGVTLVQAADGPSETGTWEDALYTALDDLVERLRATHRFILIDAPAGTEGPVRWALDRADLGVLVLVGEPTAVADAYRLAKVLWGADPDYPLSTLVNFADTEEEAESIADRFGAVTTRFTGQAPHRLGWVPYAHAIRQSVSAQRPAVRTAGPAQEAFVTLARTVASGQYALAPMLP